MKWLCTVLSSSIIKKQLMALTGILLVGFLIGHLLGNFLLIISAEAFNKYAHALVSNPLIYLAEIGLSILFLSHLGLAIKLTLENKTARGQNYFVKNKTGMGSTFASSTMAYTGAVILVFLVLHILNFKFGPVYYISYGGVEIRDLHRTVIEYFENPLHVLWYVIAMMCLGIHLSHGIQSVFQTFGFRHPRYLCTLKCKSKCLAFGIAGLFSLLAIWSYFQGTSI